MGAEMGGPFAASAPGCGADAGHGQTGALRCPEKATHAGLRYFPYPRPGVVWWSFACPAHVGQLTAARPLNEQDRAELAERRARRDAALAGREPWRPPQPLARGAEAQRLLAQARARAAEVEAVWRGYLVQITGGIDLTTPVGDDVVQRIAEQVVQQRVSADPAERYYDAAVTALRSGQQLAVNDDQDEDVVRDLLRRVLAGLDDHRPWPEPAG